MAATLVSLLALSGEARGQSSVASREATVPSDAGWRGYVVAGAPSIVGVGVGYKLGRAELLVNAGGFAYYHISIAVAQASLHVDLVRWPGGSAYVGGSYGWQRRLVGVADCPGDDADCGEEVFVRDITPVGGPRLGARALLLDRPGLGKALHLDVSVGPTLDACGRRCAGSVDLGLAGELRLVLGV